MKYVVTMPVARTKVVKSITKGTDKKGKQSVKDMTRIKSSAARNLVDLTSLSKEDIV